MNPASDESAVVVQRAFDLAVWLIQKVQQFPRHMRFTIGDRLISRALDLLESVTEAAYSKDKQSILELSNRRINSLRLLVRLARQLGLVNIEAHAFASERIEEIGRMCGGWRKSAARRIMADE